MSRNSPVRPPPSQTSGSDFARLSRKIADAGLLGRRPGYYALRITGVAGLYVSGWAAVALVGDSWWTLAAAAFLAVVFGQVALLAHDAAHRQVFRRRRASEVSGRIAGAGIGMGYGWWQDKHTRHHANPNHEELDPDLDPNLLVWSQEQARAAKGLPRLIGRWQAFLFFPLLTLEGFNLHVSSVMALANPSLKHRRLDGTLLFAHFALYLTALLWLLPPGLAITFLAVHQCLFGVYLGSLFAPNHKGMPILTGENRPDFLRRQVLTSRNVRGGRLTDIALGGLNHQIEHHLFPSMPSPNLRKARAIVRRYCQELGLDYVETGLLTSYRLALASLHQAGAPLRHARVPAQGRPAPIGGSDV
ncbi:acyl-CoA desaturase [Streptomyces europaeiscabiei]|uniref:fatty acid desaturase family protein n=1 Tax=Streptomyces europaeiscabiei TaxID=146819 RepID=UPI0029BA06C7|nr:acyl-CoA desaturase [Streptomyces europaeiscabiei]MDX3615180.1 acyl-CoA desaturase [Streptomyces europaeiscabiei]MDX3628789.1 acyl-CoA desaturase [Streptomyces europaeiscabiei]MDX3646935.1 acyl-CoA desaturase [Streptomyces europaeiscabiei]